MLRHLVVHRGRHLAVEVGGQHVADRRAGRGDGRDGALLAAVLGAQARPGPGEHVRDGVGRDPHALRDLRVRAALDLSEHQRAPLPAVQPRRRAPHLIGLLDEQRRPRGIALEVVVAAEPRLEVRVTHLVRVIALVLEVQVPRRYLEVRGHIHVGRQVRQPRDEPDEGLLRQIVGGGRVAGQAKAQAPDPGGMGRVQRGHIDAVRTRGGRGRGWSRIFPELDSGHLAPRCEVFAQHPSSRGQRKKCYVQFPAE